MNQYISELSSQLGNIKDTKPLKLLHTPAEITWGISDIQLNPCSTWSKHKHPCEVSPKLCNLKERSETLWLDRLKWGPPHHHFLALWIYNITLNISELQDILQPNGIKLHRGDKDGCAVVTWNTATKATWSISF